MEDMRETDDEPGTDADEALRKAQQGKGHGAGEGERDEILDDDAKRPDDA